MQFVLKILNNEILYFVYVRHFINEKYSPTKTNTDSAAAPASHSLPLQNHAHSHKDTSRLTNRAGVSSSYTLSFIYISR